MQLENQFLVDAPLDRTWATLLDIHRVAQCLPGAQLDSDGADGIYRGSMQVKLGPMSLRYKGTARMAEVEEDGHIATIEVEAKELKGQGTASARIRNELQPALSGATQVLVTTDLNITGRPAQFGRGIMEDVAGKMLEDFAKRLETEVLSANGEVPSPVEEPQRFSPPPPERVPSQQHAPTQGERTSQPPEAALDLVSVLAAPLAKRAVIGAGILLFVLVVLRALVGGRRSGRSISISWQ